MRLLAVVACSARRYVSVAVCGLSAARRVSFPRGSGRCRAVAGLRRVVNTMRAIVEAFAPASISAWSIIIFSSPSASVVQPSPLQCAGT